MSATYDSHTFASMGYTLINGKWYKKHSLKGKADSPKSTRISANSATFLTKEVDDIKASLFSLTNVVQDVQETLTKILQLSKD